MYKVLDCTIRDGGHQNNWDFDDNFVNKCIAEAIKNNTTYFEIGYRNHFDTEGKGKFYKCSPELVKSFAVHKSSLKIGVMTDISRFNQTDFGNAEKDFIDFVRIATHPKMIKEALDTAYILHSRGYKIFVQLMEIPNVSQEHYEILEKWDYKNILESLYIADTYSKVEPQDLEKYFTKLRNIGYKKISFHAHNGRELALKNTLKAIELGAFIIDVSQNGLGGNLNASLI